MVKTACHNYIYFKLNNNNNSNNAVTQKIHFHTKLKFQHSITHRFTFQKLPLTQIKSHFWVDYVRKFMQFWGDKRISSEVCERCMVLL